MNIKLKTVADVKQLLIKSNKDNDGREALLDILIGVKKEDAGKWGESFDALAFATMRVIEPRDDDEDAGNKIGYLVDTIKPGKNAVVEMHKIAIDGFVVTAQPSILNIKTNDGEASVVVCVRVAIPTTERKLLDSLIEKVGRVVTLEFSPVQGMLEFAPKIVKKSKGLSEAIEQANLM